MDIQTVVPMPRSIHEIFQTLQKSAQQVQEKFVLVLKSLVPNLDDTLNLTMPPQRPWWCRPRYHYLAQPLLKSQIYAVKPKQEMAAKFRKGKSQK